MPATITFEDAVREQIPARVAIFGPSGSGKSYTALLIASELAAGKPVYVIDTEHGRSRLYADKFPHKQYQLLPPHHPEHYINALNVAAKMGAAAVVLDSITHEWDGTGGVKEIVDAAKGRFGGNTHAAWSVGTPLHNKFVEAILAAPMHVIATMRSKTEWVIEEDARGRKTPRKVGLAPIQRDTIEYEFDVALLMDTDNNATVSKTHAGDVFPEGLYIEKPGVEFAQALKTWLGEGAAVDRPSAKATAEKKVEESGRVVAAPERIQELKSLVEKMQDEFGDPEKDTTWMDRVESRTVETFGVTIDEMTEDEVKRMIRSLNSTAGSLRSKAEKAGAAA